MFDFLRNLTKSAEEKRQETVTAYLDGALNGRSRQQFEQELAQDESLRQQVEQMRLIKQSLHQLPPRQVPRNFILNPAEYGRPARQPWVQAYPILRTATALAAFFFIFAVAASIFTSSGAAEQASLAPAADIAQSEAVEVTRVITEAVTEEDTLAYNTEADEAAEVAEEPAREAAVAASDEAEEAMAEEEVMAEAAVEEGSAQEEVPPAEPTTPDSFQGETTEDGAAPAPQATALIVTLTPTSAPTPTVSTLPRVTPPTPLPDRDFEQTQAEAEGANAVDDTGDGETAVHLETTESDNNRTSPLNALQWLPIGLGLLLLLLVGLTFYARRQR
jgi:hypothetical protein